MTTNPEQPVLDAIAELVDWQLEEGRRRGDGPADPVAELYPEPLAGVIAVMEHLRDIAQRMAPNHASHNVEHLQLAPGERIGWVDRDGTLHVDVVQWHREDPEGSGNWTITVGERGDSSSAPGIDTITLANGEQPRIAGGS